MDSLPRPSHMPCERCGASIEGHRAGEHACDDARVHEYELLPLRPEVDAFDDLLGSWLTTPHGRFEQFYAERNRPG